MVHPINYFVKLFQHRVPNGQRFRMLTGIDPVEIIEQLVAAAPEQQRGVMLSTLNI